LVIDRAAATRMRGPVCGLRMEGTDRTMHLLGGLALAILLVALVPAGASATRIPLPAGVHPRSLVSGPEKAVIWFIDGPHARVGRVTPDGAVRLFPMGAGVAPDELVVGSDGALWQRERASRPGRRAVALGAGPDGSVWFAIAHFYEHCGGCGGGANLLLQNMGAEVGQITTPRSGLTRANRGTGVHFPNSGGCTDPGEHHGYCSSLHLANVKIGAYFELKSFEGPGRVKLCAHAAHVPESCLSRKLRYDDEDRAWVARVSSSRAIKQSGCYTIRWVDPATGQRLGPKLQLISLEGEKDKVPCLSETDETA
jgi:hypothetical protein